MVQQAANIIPFCKRLSKTELLQLISGLTKWKIDEARKHAFKNKPGQPIEPPTLQRTRLDPVKVQLTPKSFFR